ncbi:DUF3267 domain-containing protein [Thermococcus camini]|uniref:Uncharacterized 24.7 kDa protein in gap 5'region n=1 Tax=Thermococcus camini TaxID=2016373 RepID=A0A7G2D7P2_9EURY|nr:DUF3267 domain-containing protein [Thermococcus camini]CAD5243657.1 Uncharacterized 24.7 kDa protein in gap 5'region [Thermococcus camini]
MGELRLSDYSSDIFILSLILLVVSGLAVPWAQVSVSSLGEFLYLLVLPWLVLIPLHEGLHALVARLFGARVRFGVTSFGKLIVAPYVAIETPLRARRYALVSLAPLLPSAVFLSLAWFLRSNFWALAYVFNTAGMAGDFLTALWLLRLPPDSEVFDDGTALVSDAEISTSYPGWVSPALKVAILLLFLVILILGRVEVVVENG